jgi:glycine betaine/choline ABC-type transport system substrate-binding protein
VPGRGGKRLRGGRARPAVALLAVLGLALSVAACGGGNSHSRPSKDEVALTIAARETPEEGILGHIYAEALRAAGYKVKGEFGIATEYPEVPLEELEKGRISGYPEHVNAALGTYFGVEDEGLPHDAHKAYEMAIAELRKKRLTAFPPTPFSLSRPVGLLRKTAEARGLKTVSDLKGQAEKMTLQGPTDCHFRLDCLAGIEKYYGIYFKSISYTYTEREVHRRYKVLEDGEFDASIVHSTDGQLALDKNEFVTLEDDKHIYPAGNVIFLTSRKVVEEAGPDFEKTIVAAQKGLTLPVMQQLDAEVELEKKNPAEVAAGYLKRAGLAAQAG